MTTEQEEKITKAIQHLEETIAQLDNALKMPLYFGHIGRISIASIEKALTLLQTL